MDARVPPLGDGIALEDKDEVVDHIVEEVHRYQKH